MQRITPSPNLETQGSQGVAGPTQPKTPMPDTTQATTTQTKTGPVMGQVDPKTQTMSGQMQGLLSEESPLRQQMETMGKQISNSMGMLNTSMGGSIGLDVLTKNVMPMAQQNANTYNSQAALNQGFANQDYFQKGSQDFQKEMTKDSQLFQKDVMGMSQDFQKEMTKDSQLFQKDMTQLSQNFQKEMSEIGYGQDMQKALLGYMNTALNTNNNLLAQMATSPDVTEAEYDKVRESLMNSMQTFTNIWGVSADSTDTFDFSGI